MLLNKFVFFLRRSYKALAEQVPPHAWLIGLVYGVSLIHIGKISLTPETGTFPSILSYSISFSGPQGQALANSLAVASVVALMSVVLGAWLAWVIHTKFEAKYRVWFVSTLFLPLLVNHYIRISAIKEAFIAPGFSSSVANEYFNFSWNATTYSVSLFVLGVISWTWPVSTLVIYSGFSKITRESLDAARNLGAGMVSILHYLVLPRMIIPILIALIYSFSFGITDGLSERVLNNNQLYLVPDLFDDLLSGWEWSTVAAISMIVMALEVSLLLFAIYYSSIRGTGHGR